jgi:hypothetical protein
MATRPTPRNRDDTQGFCHAECAPEGSAQAGRGGSARAGNASWPRCGPKGRHVHRRSYLLNAAIMSMTAGPSSTMNSVGRMQRISGKITLTGICIAFSSAR